MNARWGAIFVFVFLLLQSADTQDKPKPPKRPGGPPQPGQRPPRDEDKDKDPAPAAKSTEGQVDFFVSSDKRGVLLRWNIAGMERPSEFQIFRRAKNDKDFEKVADVKSSADRPKGKSAGTAKEQRQRDFMIAMIAELDVSAAKSFGLYYEDFSVKNGTRCTYELRAGSKTLATSKEVIAGDAVLVPTPSDLLAQVSRSGVQLSWKILDRAASRVSGYRIYRDQKKINDLPVVGGEYVDTGVQDNQTYSYAVASVDAFGRESSVSRAVSITHRDIVPPAAPSSIQSQIDNETVKLTWQASEDRKTIGYNVYRMSPKGRPEKITSKPIAQTSFDDKPGTGLYTYTVTAVDARGNESTSSYSHEGQTRLHGGAAAKIRKKTAPLAPRSISAELSGSSSSVSWAAIPEAKRYIVYRATSEKGPWRRVAVVKDPKFSEKVQSSFDEGFFYKVSAVDDSGNESESTPVRKVAVEGKIRPQVKGLSSGSNKIALNLKNSKNLKNIEIYRTKDDPASPTAKWEIVSTLAPDAKEFVDSTAKGKGKYSYAVATVDKSGKSSSKSVVSGGSSSSSAGGTKDTFGGFTVTMTSATEGTVRIPYLNIDVPVKVSMLDGVISGLELNGEASAKLEQLGSMIKITDLDFGSNYVEIDGEVSIALSGTLTVDKVEFKGLQIGTDGKIKSATLGVKTIGVSFEGFEVAIKNLTIALSGNKKTITFTGSIQILDILEEAEASLTIEEGQKVTLNKVEVEFEEWDVHVKGEVEFNKANQSFKGKVNVELQSLELGIDLEFQAGKKNDYSYFMINGTLTFPVPIPLGNTSLGINAFGGGFAYNMEAKIDKSNNITFTPKKGGFVFMASVGIATMDGGQIFSGVFTLTISTGPVVGLKGSGVIVTKVKVESSMTVSEDGFWLTASVSADIDPIIKGKGTMDVFFGKGKNNWHIYIGTEDSPVSGEVFGGKFGKGTFYVMITPDKFKAHVDFTFDTGNLEAWIFYGRASFSMDMTVEVNLKDWSFNAKFSTKGSFKGGVRTEVLGKEIDFSFKLNVKASGTVERKSGKSVSVDGKFSVEVEIPVLGKEDVEFAF